MMIIRTYCAAAIMAAAVLAIGCGKKKEPVSGGDGRSALDTAQLAPGASQSPQPDSAAVADTVSSEPEVTHTATISTSMGDIVVDLYGKDAPKTVENFVALANKKYYDGVAFHRVIPGFMVQTGDPNSRNMADRSSWGTGGEAALGGTFDDELNPETPSYRRGYLTGTLAMANSGPNTNGSQFFIVLSTQGAMHLPHSYTIFGAVRKGMDVVERIGQTGATGENPTEPAILKSVKATPAEASTAGKPASAKAGSGTSTEPHAGVK